MRWKETEYSGWGRVLKAKGSLARPERISELDAVISQGPAPAIGNLRSYGDAPLNGDGRAIVMTRLDRFIAFDASTGTNRHVRSQQAVWANLRGRMNHHT